MTKACFGELTARHNDEDDDGDEDEDGSLMALPQSALTADQSVDQSTTSSIDKKDTSSEEIAPQPDSLLMGLPAEMRNWIYRACLVEADCVEILSTDAASNLPTEPAILRCCRRSRKEAIGIYYQENTFFFVIDEHDARNYIKWCRSAERRLCSNNVFIVVWLTNWSNLERWMEAYWNRECRRPNGIEGMDFDDECDIVGQLGDLCRQNECRRAFVGYCEANARRPPPDAWASR